MAIYLLDFENVHDSGISGVTSLTENDELCIFYSVKSEHMSFETHVNIMKTAAKVKYIKLRRAAKNYLDFQLCTHLGYIIGAGFEGPFYIISKDTGYDSAIDYWKDHGVTIIRQPSIGFNRSLGKSTGQNPTHNTPPALVTFKQGNVITNPDVQSLYKLDTASAPKDAPEALPEAEAVVSETAETPAEEIYSEEVFLTTEADNSEGVSIPAEIDVIPETAAAAEPEASAPEKSSSGSSGKKKKSRSSKAVEKPAEEAPALKEVEAVSDAPAAADSSEQKGSDGENGSSAEEAPANAASTRSGRSSRSRRSSSKKTDESKEAAVSQDIAASEPETAPQPETAAAEPAAAPEETAEPVPEKVETLPESYRKRVRTALKGRNIPSAYYASIYKAILNSYDKLALNNLLVKTFGSSKGGEVYKQIKEIFMDFQS